MVVGEGILHVILGHQMAGPGYEHPQTYFRRFRVKPCSAFELNPCLTIDLHPKYTRGIIPRSLIA